MLFNPATKRLVEYGIIGLAIAAVLVAGLQMRPGTILPSNGTLQVAIAADPSVTNITCSNPNAGLHVTSLNVTISSITVHRAGVLNLTGEWINIVNFTKTIDLVKVTNVTQLLGSASLPEGTVNLIRLTIANATATTASGQSISVIVSSGHLDAQMSTEVTGGRTTTVVVTPHLVCEGNGILRLTPVLTAMSRGPD